MTLTRSLPNQNPTGLPAVDERRILAGLLARNADGTARVGILPAPAGATLVTGRAEMAYDVAPFIAALARTTAGVEFVANDAVTRVPTTAAPQSNSRIDVIWVRGLFPLAGDAGTDPVFGVTQGAVAAVPLKPSIPAGAFELATSTVTSTTVQTSTAVITQTYACTAAAGGVVPFRNRTEMQTWAAAEGSLARDVSTGDLYDRVGTAWVSQEGGMRLIFPSSVTGGTIVDGVVQLSGGDTVTINGVFSSRFRRYLVMADWAAAGGTNGALLKLCSGGNASSANYDLQALVANGGPTPSSGYTPSAAAFSATANAGNSHAMRYEFFSPGLPAMTMLNVQGTTYPAGVSIFGATHTLGTAYDGLRLELSTKAAGRAFTSGEIAVYGLA